jgi:xylose dehydrogenase (NAD/NADP)
MSIVRWGLLSTARINRRVIPAIRASARGRVVAVASRDQAVADSYASQWEIPRAFGSYEAMLESGDVDAIYNPLPNHLHAEWTIRALERGKHVLCEKPFALSLTDVDRMAEAARRSGRVLAEAFMYRHHPQTKQVGEWVRGGRLGEVTLVRGIFSFQLTDPANIRMRPEMGGGSLWDIGVYPLSFAQYVFGGAPISVLGHASRGETGVDVDFAGQMTYEKGRVAQIACSFQNPFNTSIEIVGLEARATLNRPFISGDDGTPRELCFYPPQGETEVTRASDTQPYLYEIEDMHDAILEGAAPYLSLDETRQHVLTALALYESAATARIVELASFRAP